MDMFTALPKTIPSDDLYFSDEGHLCALIAFQVLARAYVDNL